MYYLTLMNGKSSGTRFEWFIDLVVLSGKDLILIIPDGSSRTNFYNCQSLNNWILSIPLKILTMFVKILYQFMYYTVITFLYQETSYNPCTTIFLYTDSCTDFMYFHGSFHKDE